MKGLYATALAAAIAVGGCGYKSYKPMDVGQSVQGKQRLTCVPIVDLINDDGFACRDSDGSSVYVEPDRSFVKKGLFWKQSPYKSAMPLLMTHAANGEEIIVTGKRDGNKLEAILLDFGEEGQVFLNH